MRTPKFNQADVDDILALLEIHPIKKVAQLIGVTYVTVWKIKKGKYVPRVSEVSGLVYDRPGIIETIHQPAQ